MQKSESHSCLMKKVASIIYPKYDSINIYNLVNEPDKEFINKENMEILDGLFKNSDFRLTEKELYCDKIDLQFITNLSFRNNTFLIAMADGFYKFITGVIIEVINSTLNEITEPFYDKIASYYRCSAFTPDDKYIYSEKDECGHYELLSLSNNRFYFSLPNEEIKNLSSGLTKDMEDNEKLSILFKNSKLIDSKLKEKFNSTDVSFGDFAIYISDDLTLNYYRKD